MPMDFGAQAFSGRIQDAGIDMASMTLPHSCSADQSLEPASVTVYSKQTAREVSITA
jgi:hypothetical protein